MTSIIPDPATKVVWFLTGSQGLYGEETLAQVAAQSREVVGLLADAEEIPVTVEHRPVLTSPDASAQLVQLRQAEPVRVDDDDHRRVRHVDAHLDDGRRDENVDLAGAEAAHDVVLLLGGVGG